VLPLLHQKVGGGGAGGPSFEDLVLILTLIVLVLIPTDIKKKRSLNKNSTTLCLQSFKFAPTKKVIMRQQQSICARTW